MRKPKQPKAQHLVTTYSLANAPPDIRALVVRHPRGSGEHGRSRS